MSNFTLHKNIAESKKYYPFLIDVQNQIFSDLTARLVIPVALLSDFQNTQIKTLNPVIIHQGKHYIVLTQQMASITTKALGESVQEIMEKRNEILAAIDFLITGF